MEEIQDKNQNEDIERPKFLTILCVLTFIFTGLGALSSIITPLSADLVKAYIMSAPNYDEALMAESLRVIDAGWGYYLLNLFLTLGSMTGAIMMWRMKKVGFHFYAISNLAMLFVPTLVLGIAISWVAIFLTVSFIGMYALHLKFLR